MANSCEPEVHVLEHQAPVLCDDYDSNDADSECVDSNASACDTCNTDDFNENPTELTHKEEKQTQNIHPCQNHPGNMYANFCKTCNKPCCQNCLASDHELHSLANIDETAESVKTDVQTYLKTLEAVVLPTIDNVHSFVKDGMAKYDKAFDKAQHDSKIRFQALREEIDNMEKEWVQQQIAIKEKDMEEIEQARKEIEVKRKQTTDLIAECKSVIAESDDVHMLRFRLNCPNVADTKPSTMYVPGTMTFQASNYKLPILSELIGQLGRGERIGIDADNCREDEVPLFTSDMVEVSIVKTIEDVRCDHIILTKNNEFWINDQGEGSLTLYNENSEQLKVVPLDISISDMALTCHGDIIATDLFNRRVLRISDTGDITELIRMKPLVPWTCCVNDEQQIVVGVRGEFRRPPIKLVVFSADGSDVVQEIEKDNSGNPLFNKAVYQVRQNSKGDYMVSDNDRIVCLSKKGVFRWDYRVKPVARCVNPNVNSIACDKYDNVIINDFHVEMVSLLSSDGKCLKTINDCIAIPCSLSVDKNGLLWVGQAQGVTVMKYIK